MPHVFISYSRKDTPFTERLECSLKDEGIETWRDQNSIVGGEDWYKAIVQGIHQSYVVLSIVTPAADESRWVLRESLYADQQGIPIIPILPTPHRIPFHLISTQPINFDDYEAGISRLISALRNLPQNTHLSTKPLPILGVKDVATELAYLDFLLSERNADLLSAQYVSLSATPETRITKQSRLPGQRQPRLERLGIERVDDTLRPGETVPDARIPIRGLRRVVLLGEPGAGKTTTLNQLAVDLALDAKTAIEAGQVDVQLPVFVPLRTFTGEVSFSDFVRAQMATLQSQYDLLLHDKRLILLCDALNEMPRHGADGHDLVAEVREYLRDKPYWTVSCRLRDYEEALSKLSETSKVRIKPLDPPRIREIIFKRFSDTPERANQLWQEIQGSSELLKVWSLAEQFGKTEAFWGQRGAMELFFGSITTRPGAPWQAPGYSAWQKMNSDSRKLLSLCRNPYMLFLMCEIFDLKNALPQNRGELFATFVDDLLAREEENSRAAGSQWVNHETIRSVLAHLAYVMQSNNRSTTIPRSEAENLSSNRETWMQPVVFPHDVKLILRLAAAASLIDYSETVRFTHQLLQEYFASEILGWAMDNNVSATQFWPTDSWWKPQGWEETAIILAGVRGDPEAVARWIAPAQPEFACDVLRKGDIQIAFDQIAPETRLMLTESAKLKKDQPSFLESAAAYRVLGHLKADDRAGIGVFHASYNKKESINSDIQQPNNSIPSIVWCLVNSGSFLYGKKRETRNVPYNYVISKYPITNTQFQAFIEAPDGYNQVTWWTPSGWKWKAKRTKPEEYSDSRFGLSNHPRIYVCWYEAVAFCNWLTAQLYPTVWGRYIKKQSNTFVPKIKNFIRLPTDEEWEKAARGVDGRYYPWGNAFDVQKCNCSIGETAIRRTSAVGIFPSGQSPYGVLDMSGNVWEWCLTENKSHNNKLSGTDVRILRGGSWINLDSVRLCTYDYYIDSPHYMNNSIGFRVAYTL